MDSESGWGFMRGRAMLKRVGARNDECTRGGGCSDVLFFFLFCELRRIVNRNEHNEEPVTDYALQFSCLADGVSSHPVFPLFAELSQRFRISLQSFAEFVQELAKIIMSDDNA
jgi:hypothetical protein